MNHTKKLIFMVGTVTILSACTSVSPNVSLASQTSATPIPTATPATNCQQSANQSSSSFAGGTGTASSPYLICTANQLNLIGANSALWGKSYKLMANIDLSVLGTTSFNIIGTSAAPFTGSIDGNGMIISNLTINSTGNNVGFIGFAGGSASIKNLTLNNPNITGGTGVGALLGADDGQGGVSIDQVIISGQSASVTATTANAGGIAGKFSGSMSSSTSSASVSENLSGAGGLIGVAQIGSNAPFVVSGCSNYGRVNGQDSEGGIIGYVTSTVATASIQISNTINYGTISSQARAGGIVGFVSLSGSMSFNTVGNNGSISSLAGPAGGIIGSVAITGGTINQSYSSANITSANGADLGGLVGQISGSMNITSSYTTGSIGGSNPSMVGGLVGAFTSSGAGPSLIANSYSSATVLGASSVGGLLGLIHGSSTLNFQYSYASGLTSSTNTTNFGGLTGNDQGNGVYLETFFDHTENNTLSPMGSASSNSSQIASGQAAGQSTSYLQAQASMTSGAGWSLANWVFPNSAYPKLIWQP